MSVPDYPLVNGHRFSFASIEAVIAGRKFVGFKSIQYSSALEPGEVRGAHPEVLGATRGKATHDGSVEIYREEWQALIIELNRRSNGKGFLEVYFQIVVNVAEDGSPTVTDTLRGCRMKKAQGGGTEGTDPLSVPSDLWITKVKWGGLDPVTPLVQSGLHF